MISHQTLADTLKARLADMPSDKLPSQRFTMIPRACRIGKWELYPFCYQTTGRLSYDVVIDNKGQSHVSMNFSPASAVKRRHPFWPVLGWYLIGWWLGRLYRNHGEDDEDQS